ncbi:TPA: hypothetical protein N0F65_010341 [Lagenidium giganteum]|uniref:Uncharacterized protein n=1 Tax=Lagenidium giganteum TaxID=4803 RepID=A0AAV2Z7F4_9STRA|nr:TPA: hypothetical protein N0F65_010341 [Lagenidium giganteum]
MAVERRAAAAKDKDVTKAKEKTSKGANEEKQEPPPVPLLLRVVTIGLTSFLAEKIWRHRTLISQHWYSDRQTETERAMVTLFEYITAMGLLFFMGLLVSKLTMLLQPKAQ